MVEGKSFWIPVAIGLMAVIVGALAVSTSSPRLVVSVGSIAAQYIMTDAEQEGKSLNSEEGIAKLTTQVRDRLTRHAMLAFREDGNSSTSVDVYKDDLSKEKFLSGIGVLEVNVTARATNIGGGSSTIDRLESTIVEEISGQRHPIEGANDAELNVKIGQGEPVLITPDGGQKFYFVDSLAVLVDYETVRLLASKTVNISGSDRSEIISPFLGLLTLSNRPRQERLITLADPQKRCRLVVVVRAYDTLGRVGVGEAEIITAAPPRAGSLR